MVMKRSLIATFLGLFVLLCGYLLANASEIFPIQTTVVVTPIPTKVPITPSAVPVTPTLVPVTKKPRVATPVPIRRSVKLNVPVFNQRKLGYLSGCETVSLGMLINYETEVDISTLISEIPSSSDPTKGFRGDIRTMNGFTILPMALTELTEKYLGTAKDLSGGTTEDLKEQLNAEHPIVIWVNGLGFNVHAICLTGYDEEGFFYSDPWTGEKNVFIEYDAFYKIWDTPIYDKHFGISYPTRLALSY